MVLAVLALLSLFVFPLWKIVLYAPQYPDGVKMHIWINKIGGETESTLQNINILNHYVGMKKIEPDDIPELNYFPYIILFMAALGLVAAVANKKGLYLAWVVLMVALAVAGLYDFYLWEYDYGHTLDPHAPMQFEGESFQPPLFGTKHIINFTAVSLPHIGGYFAGLSILLAALAWWFKRKIAR